MRKKKIILVVGLVIIILAGVIFWIGKKCQKEEVNQVKTNQKIELERQLQQLKNQSQKETNPTKNPLKTSRRFMVKYNGSIVGRHWYTNVANAKEQISIDAKQSFFSDDALYKR